MKNLFILIFSFISFSIYSQNSVETLDGKIYKDCNFLSFIGNDILFNYNSKKTRVKINDIKECMFENIRIENILINGKQNSYSIISSYDNKRLVGFTSYSDTNTNYIYYIIDSNNNILHTLQFTNGLTKKSIQKREVVEDIIKKEFSNCIELLNAIDNCLPDKYLVEKEISKSKRDRIIELQSIIKEKSRKSKENIIYFFDKREYVSCNK